MTDKMTGYFKTPLRDFKYVPYLKDGHIVRNRVVLVNDVVWVDEDDIHHVVPRGFVFDLASLPLSSFLVRKLGRHQRASALHDWFYANQTKGKLWADSQMDSAMEFDQVRAFRIEIINIALFFFGGVAWYTKDEVVIVDPDTMKPIA